MSRSLNFGVFITPFHPTGQSPTVALEYDMLLGHDWPSPQATFHSNELHHGPRTNGPRACGTNYSAVSARRW